LTKHHPSIAQASPKHRPSITQASPKHRPSIAKASHHILPRTLPRTLTCTLTFSYFNFEHSTMAAIMCSKKTLTHSFSTPHFTGLKSSFVHGQKNEFHVLEKCYNYFSQSPNEEIYIPHFKGKIIYFPEKCQESKAINGQ
jgi:hypothetical protein